MALARLAIYFILFKYDLRVMV